jgi:hypothetical protein
MGQEVFVCLKTDKKCTCEGDIGKCNFPEKKEKEMKPKKPESEKTQDAVIRERIMLLEKRHKELGVQIEKYTDIIQQLAKHRLSIKGGVLELRALLPKKQETPPVKQPKPNKK